MSSGLIKGWGGALEAVSKQSMLSFSESSSNEAHSVTIKPRPRCVCVCVCVCGCESRVSLVKQTSSH